ncbi:MAG: ribonuclease D [Alphaproteobacteria bacterium]|nr:ribonuclease D [Alphaproteobacteria bacterium]MDE6570768.1 ribonuclease D [Alphaproteobacteria bacterium]
MNIIYQDEDLSQQQTAQLMDATELAVDTELTGLDVHADNLCLVQMRARGSDDYYLIHIRDNRDYPNVARVLGNRKCLKIFHYARMDMVMIYKRLGIWAAPVFCTKIGVLLARPNRGHTLHNSLREIFNITLDKDECCSDWTGRLTTPQKQYAAADVMHLHMLKDYLVDSLADKNRLDLAQKCFEFLPTRCELDMNWGARDIFGYNPKNE